MTTDTVVRGIVRTGIDVVDVARFRRFIDRHASRLDEIFTRREQARCEGSRTRVERYACRFAAKESFLKAVGTLSMFDLAGPHHWTDVEVLTDGLGKPRIVAHGALRGRLAALGVEGVDVSLSHSALTAIAHVVLTRDPLAMRRSRCEEEWGQ
jgi:holo-[acyl-carrier protein] synthase